MSGNLGAGVISRKPPGRESELTVQSTAEVKAKSYIWKPWFASLDGDGAVAYERQSGRAESAGNALRIAGDLGLSILPFSRFPTSVSVSRLDSSVEGRLSGSDFVRDRVAFSNSSIITGKLRTTIGGAFDHSVQENGGKRTGKHLYASATQQFGKNILGLSGLTAAIDYMKGDFTSPVEDNLAEDTLTATFAAQMAPTEALRNEMRVTFIQDNDASDTTRTDRQSIQAVDTFYWTPPDKKYSVDGFIRVRREDLTIESNSIADDRRNDQFNSIVNLNVPLNDRLQFRVGFRGGIENNENVSGGRQQGEARFAALNASGAYTSRTREFGPYEWRWGARASGEAGYESRSDLLRKPTVAVNHTLERDFNVFEAGPLEMALTQEVGLDPGVIDSDTTDNSGLTTFIAHGLSLNHNRTTRASATSINLSIRDFRELSGEGNALQTAQLQFNRRQIIDARKSFSGVLTFNGMRRNLNGRDETFITATGRLAYGHRSVFNVLNLDFRSELAVNIFELEELFSQNPTPTANDDIQHHEWRNMLAYRIGQIAFIAEASLFYEDEGLGDLFMFRIQRDLGGR